MAMSGIEAAFIQLNTSATADSVDGLVATFNNRTIATPPTGFPTIKIKDFEIYLNNRRIANSHIYSIAQNGTNIDVTVNVASFLDLPGAVFENDDEVLMIGKFT